MGTPEATQLRDKVSRMAATAPDEALEIARRIRDPWFRCQALAVVGMNIADMSRKRHVLHDAFDAAMECDAPNLVVMASSWPLKALCKSASPRDLERETQRLLGIIDAEPSPVQRAQALNMMLGAVLTGPRALFWTVLERMEQASFAPLANGKRNAKGESLMTSWAVVVHQYDPARAQRIIAAIHGHALRERALTAIEEHGAVDVEALCNWPRL